MAKYSIISNKATIGENVVIGDYVKIYDNVIIGDNVVIEDYCEIGVENSLCSGNPLQIGSNSHIRSKSIIYADSIIGEHLITGHNVTIREKSQIGKNVQIGTLSDIQGHCIIGDYVKMHSNVHIGQKSEIANHVWIFPYVVLTNDPHPPSETLLGCKIEEFAVICTMSVILPGVIIKQGALIGAHSSVTKNVNEERIVVGSPAKDIAHVSKIKLKNNPEHSAYPWRKHFHRGYDEKDIQNWINEFKENSIT